MCVVVVLIGALLLIWECQNSPAVGLTLFRLHFWAFISHVHPPTALLLFTVYVLVTLHHTSSSITAR